MPEVQTSKQEETKQVLSGEAVAAIEHIKQLRELLNKFDGDLPPVMTIKQVQHYLQIGQARAYELFQIQEDPPPHIRIGRSIRVPRDAFLEWLERNAWKVRCIDEVV